MAIAKTPSQAAAAPDEANKTRWREMLIESGIRLAAFSSIAIIALIFLFLLREGLPAFLDIPLRRCWSAR